MAQGLIGIGEGSDFDMYRQNGGRGVVADVIAQLALDLDEDVGFAAFLQLGIDVIGIEGADQRHHVRAVGFEASKLLQRCQYLDPVAVVRKVYDKAVHCLLLNKKQTSYHPPA